MQEKGTYARIAKEQKEYQHQRRKKGRVDYHLRLVALRINDLKYVTWAEPNTLTDLIIFNNKLTRLLIVFYVNFLIIISNSSMFFGLDTQANLDDQDYSEMSLKVHQFPKTTDSSPDSFKSGCSFELHL